MCHSVTYCNRDERSINQDIYSMRKTVRAMNQFENIFCYTSSNKSTRANSIDIWYIYHSTVLPPLPSRKQVLNNFLFAIDRDKFSLLFQEFFSLLYFSLSSVALIVFPLCKCLSSADVCFSKATLFHRWIAPGKSSKKSLFFLGEFFYFLYEAHVCIVYPWCRESSSNSQTTSVE